MTEASHRSTVTLWTQSTCFYKLGEARKDGVLSWSLQGVCTYWTLADGILSSGTVSHTFLECWVTHVVLFSYIGNTSSSWPEIWHTEVQACFLSKKLFCFGMACGVCDGRSPRNRVIKIEMLGWGVSLMVKGVCLTFVKLPTSATTKQNPRNRSLSVQGATWGEMDTQVPEEGAGWGLWCPLESLNFESVRLIGKRRSLSGAHGGVWLLFH